MNNDTTSKIGDVVARVQDNAADLGHRASELGHKAVSALDGQRGSAADGLDSAAAGLDANAGRLPPAVSPFARQAAEKIGATADYVRSNKMKDMASDVGKYAKAHPVQVLVGALMVGYFAGRMLRRSSILS
jgi:hypothetical protein